jgi:hypothetical protein
VIFISFEKGDSAHKIVERVLQEVEGIQFVAFHKTATR